MAECALEGKATTAPERNFPSGELAPRGILDPVCRHDHRFRYPGAALGRVRFVFVRGHGTVDGFPEASSGRNSGGNSRPIRPEISFPKPGIFRAHQLAIFCGSGEFEFAWNAGQARARFVCGRPWREPHRVLASQPAFLLRAVVDASAVRRNLLFRCRLRLRRANSGETSDPRYACRVPGAARRRR
jgi:hypothetical protein